MFSLTKRDSLIFWNLEYFEAFYLNKALETKDKLYLQ